MFLVKYTEENAPYAIVWKVESKGNAYVVSLSTSEKKKQNNEETTEYYNWFGVMFVGHAKNKIEKYGLPERTKIRPTSMKFTAPTVTSKTGEKKTYINLTVFDFEYVDYEPQQPQSAPEEEDDLPI